MSRRSKRGRTDEKKEQEPKPQQKKPRTEPPTPPPPQVDVPVDKKDQKKKTENLWKLLNLLEEHAKLEWKVCLNFRRICKQMKRYFDCNMLSDKEFVPRKRTLSLVSVFGNRNWKELNTSPFNYIPGYLYTIRYFKLTDLKVQREVLHGLFKKFRKGQIIKLVYNANYY